MLFSHQGRKSHLFLISNNDTTQYAQSEIKQRKKIGFLLPKGTDVIYTHFWSVFKNGFKCWNHFRIQQNLQSRCFHSLSWCCHWDIAYTVLAESMTACKLQPQVFKDFHVVNKKESDITACEEETHFNRNVFKKNSGSLAILFLDNACVLHAIHLYNVYILYLHRYYMSYCS